MRSAAKGATVPAMDLRAFTVHRAERRIDVTTVRGAGEDAHVLTGPAHDRLEPLLAALWARLPGGPARLAVDVFARSLAQGEGPTSAADFAAVVEPLAQLARAIRGELLARTPDAPGLGPSDAGFWDPLFLADAGGWELGRPSPPLASWFSAHVPKDLRALVPGCGRGHEARLLAGLGARVTAIDLSPTAIARAIAVTDPALRVDFQVRDLFTLPRAPAFDLVVEHTCFCAIDPARREEYVDLVADVLVPGGELVGVFYAHGRPGGPPFTTSADEVASRFARRFELLALATATDSTLVRHGHELLGRLRRR